VTGKERGFTLIELLIVMTIIAILATAAVPQIFDATQRAEEAVLRQDLHIMRDAIDQYRADNGEYPQRLQDLAANAYLREIPEDPITDSRSTWIVVRADWELLEEGERPGIWDVRSGAQGAGLNGIEYRQW
jgi:general secretion pathway protein G